jgi:phosphopantetheinyl transferase
LCSKCAPEYTYERGGKLYYKDRKEAMRFSILIAGMLHALGLEDKNAIGIEEIKPHGEQDCITVIFKGKGRNK